MHASEVMEIPGIDRGGNGIEKRPGVVASQTDGRTKPGIIFQGRE